MAGLIARMLSRLSRREWRIYFVKRGVGLEYALHNRDGWALLGYLHAELSDQAKRVSDEWKVLLSYYTGRGEECFQLTEEIFTDAKQFAALIAKCRVLDRGFDNDPNTGWSPVFVHVPTRKRLPLGGPTEADFQDISKYIERRFAQADVEEVSFSDIANQVFVH